ncbi:MULTISPECIES: DUF6440 family protein [Paenibacillus]|uniref:DUF6440 domain-containing protein n=1 Tax=Paenibacillus amylolyticus TaxID=1451 RepID=A0A100VLG4_PAEAM|nr:MULTISPECIES: DUF6440 family protein [Paenibacillus]GAS82058.1 unknown protein [Paenibacillus amylolyticus]
MKKEPRFGVEHTQAESAVMTQVITDNETGVQYLLAIFPNVGSGLTVLLDKEGKPLLKK